jgi:hypothetical protein
MMSRSDTGEVLTESQQEPNRVVAGSRRSPGKASAVFSGPGEVSIGS